MARAKRTARADARAEARRRYRAQQASVSGDLDRADADDDDADATAPSPRRATSSGRPAASTPVRPGPPAGGIRNAFRLAFRPPNLREDLALLPRLLVHRAFWLPVLIAGIVTGVIVAFQGREIISGILAQYFLGPAPMGSVFLAGFLAPRASYLIGLLVGAICGVLTIVAGFSIVPTADPNAVMQVLTLAPINGLFFAAAAAWYRRFLYLASPARQGQPPRRGAPPARGKPARGR